MGWFRNRDNNENAYILVYEKIKKNPLQLEFSSKEEMDRILPTLSLSDFKVLPKTDDISTGIQRVSIDYYHLKPYVPDDLFA